MSRLVVAAVVFLAAVAVADAMRARAPAPSREPTVTVVTLNSHGVIRDDASESISRQFVETHILRSGRVVLTPEQIAHAFPAELGGRLEIRDIATAPDGTLVVVAVRSPRGRPARGALEFWRDGRLRSAFTVAAAQLDGGLGFSSDGLVALYSSDRTRATLFDGKGKAVARVGIRGG